MLSLPKISIATSNLRHISRRASRTIMAALAIAPRSWSLTIPSLQSWSALRPWSLPCEPSSSTTATLPANTAATPMSALSERPWNPISAGFASLLELLPPILLAVPKSKVSHSRKSMRSANKGLKNKTNFSNCEACGMIKLAHNICPNCYSQISRRWKQEAREGSLPQKSSGSPQMGSPSL